MTWPVTQRAGAAPGGDANESATSLRASGSSTASALGLLEFVDARGLGQLGKDAGPQARACPGRGAAAACPGSRGRGLGRSSHPWRSSDRSGDREATNPHNGAGGSLVDGQGERLVRVVRPAASAWLRTQFRWWVRSGQSRVRSETGRTTECQEGASIFHAHAC